MVLDVTDTTVPLLEMETTISTDTDSTEDNCAVTAFFLEEVSCIPENILCEVYVVKFWEGMV